MADAGGGSGAKGYFSVERDLHNKPLFNSGDHTYPVIAMVTPRWSWDGFFFTTPSEKVVVEPGSTTDKKELRRLWRERGNPFP
jgi:hypothetical protein